MLAVEISSGGEKKRNEILQLAVLEADVAILDEIDSGVPLHHLASTFADTMPQVSAP